MWIAWGRRPMQSCLAGCWRSGGQICVAMPMPRDLLVVMQPRGEKTAQDVLFSQWAKDTDRRLFSGADVSQVLE